VPGLGRKQQAVLSFPQHTVEMEQRRKHLREALCLRRSGVDGVAESMKFANEASGTVFDRFSVRLGGALLIRNALVEYLPDNPAQTSYRCPAEIFTAGLTTASVNVLLTAPAA